MRVRIPPHEQPLTDHQKRVLRLIATMTRRDGYALSAALGVGPTGCRDTLARLATKGKIEWTPFTSRTLTLSPAGYQAIGLWCPVCQKPAFELYAIPDVFTMRCVPCAGATITRPS